VTIGCASNVLGTFYYLVEDAFIGGDLARGLAWEYDVLALALRELSARGTCSVIDVGAHIGTQAIPYARQVRGRGCVFAFEPQPVMLDLLRRNIEANGCTEDIVVHPYAVGHIDGLEVTLAGSILDGPNAGRPYAYRDGQAFNYGGLQLGFGETKVTMRTLDSFELTEIGLIKVDAEGSEPMVFWGARELIRRCRPLLLFERNDKIITESMQAMMPVPEEVRAFRVEEYASALGYAAPVAVGVDQFLLRPRACSPMAASF
jgi:FkbM family methyltransferase